MQTCRGLFWDPSPFSMCSLAWGSRVSLSCGSCRRGLAPFWLTRVWMWDHKEMLLHLLSVAWHVE